MPPAECESWVMHFRRSLKRTPSPIGGGERVGWSGAACEKSESLSQKERPPKSRWENKQTNKPPKGHADERTRDRQTRDKRGQTEKTTNQEKGQTSERAESQSAPQNARHISASPNRPQIPPVDIRLDRRVDHRRIRHHARQDDVLHVVGDL